MYRILVIPGARDGLGGTLDLGAELDRLTTLGMRFDALSVTMLPEGLSELDITDRLAINSTDYDAVHLLGHADDNGFYQNQNDVLTKESIKSICRDAGARTVFINSCSSARMGQYLVNNGMAVAICYAVPVMDQQALINAVRFYAALAKSNDPFQDGIREAYDAADPGDGALLWLTNGAYVEAIIAPIMDRLDIMDGRHNRSFAQFQNLIDSLSSRVNGLLRATTHTRYALITTLAVIILSTIILVWTATAFTSSFAQTIPPTGTIPPKDTHGATPQKPTHTSPSTPIPTAAPSNTPIPTVAPSSTPNPTAAPSSTPRPTAAPSSTPIPTVAPSSTPIPTVAPSSTPIPTAAPSSTPRPTNTKIPPTATWTEFETVVNLAVQATITAWSGCAC